MIEEELARVLHIGAEYIIVAIIIGITWMMSSNNESRRWKKRIKEFAPNEANEIIEKQKIIIMNNTNEIRELKLLCSKYKESVDAGSLMAKKAVESLYMWKDK